MDMYQKRKMRRENRENLNQEEKFHKVVLNWYPGHMAKTKREIKEKIDLIDIVYEVIDARMPKSSKIIDLDDVIGNKKRVLIVTKYDLCDKEVTDKFLNDYSKNYPVIKVNLKNNDNSLVKKIIDLTNELLKDINIKRQEKGLNKRNFRALVVGVPNAGKSTLINRLVGRNAAKTGNMAGVTKNLSWIRVNNNIELLDSPGILWPKFEDQTVALNLASLTSIKEEILDREMISSYILSFLYQNYPNILEEKYKIKEVDLENIQDTFDEIGKRRGCLLKGGIIDYEKVYSIIINDLKEGKISNITFDRY